MESILSKDHLPFRMVLMLQKEAVEMMGTMRSDVCSGMFRSSTNLVAFESMVSKLNANARTSGPDDGSPGGFDRFTNAATPAPPDLAAGEAPKVSVPLVREGPKVGRNDPCPCGSGKKYKKCCGASVAA